MKFTLKDYQESAVSKILDNLAKANRRWRSEGERSAFSLTAATGAGKTVMAAAVFEALLHGDDSFEFEADPGAVVLWFSDDPALNEQTRFRIMQSSDRLTISDLVVVQSTFNSERFEAGKIYFLNTQKLSKTSLLVRGHDPESERYNLAEAFPEMRPDLRSHTIWDTIRNTIEDPDLTLYLALDEAHRGMRQPASDEERSTIVKRLINGVGSVPAVPVVWGISATVDRFNAAMAEAKDRSILPNVIVDSTQVQESGLLKDTIILDVPNEVGHFDTVLVRRAIDKLRDSSDAWAEYARQQGDANVVKPLLVLQVPNTPDHNEIGRALDAVFERWPELSLDAVANVLGEHTTQSFGRYQVPYISPERVQDSTWVRVLIAKDAISTGWDCPRAEVMVSFRPARDRTHITQLLGRMVRTPLARRIPGNDRLNSVECLLPFFDAASVRDVVKTLMNGDGDGGFEGRRVLINPREMKRNPAVIPDVWEKFITLPSQSLPQQSAKPIKRLTVLAHELSTDGLLPDAGKVAHAELHKVLDAARTRYSKEIYDAQQKVLTVEGRALRFDVANNGESFSAFFEDADTGAIEGAYHRAARAFSRDLARTYAEHLANGGGMTEDALIEAYAVIASLGLVPEVRVYLEDEAEKLTKSWLTTYRIEIKSLSDERQEAYRQIRGMSAHPQDIDLAMPTSWMEPTAVREADGREAPLPRYAQHLMCGDDGFFPATLGSWELGVLEKEMARPGFLAWYRNPSRPTQDSLAIVYRDSADTKLMRPDFIFFSQDHNGSVVADIVDPHGTQLSDALPKLRGLARYVETHGVSYRRVESVAKVGSKLRALDMTREDVRHAVERAKDASSLYGGDLAEDL